MFVSERDQILDRIEPVAKEPLHFQVKSLVQPEIYGNLVLEPFYGIHDSRYEMYWRTVEPAQYQNLMASMKASQQAKLILDQRTLDRVIPGEQQPESDHFMKHERSEGGNYRNHSLRHVQSPGWFSYDLKVDPAQDLSLYVLYWGNESGRRTLDILIDGEPLVTENLVGQWNKDEFVAAEYPLPADLLASKTKVTVRFQPHRGHTAGGIYDVRILKGE